MQKYATGYGVPDWLRELEDFYEQISSLLVLDTYFLNYIDPGLLDALEENIDSYAGDMDSENGDYVDSDYILSTLYYIKQQIIETSGPRKYKFNMGLSGMLSFSQSSEEFEQSFLFCSRKPMLLIFFQIYDSFEI